MGACGQFADQFLMADVHTIEDSDGEPGILNLRGLQRRQVLHVAT